MLRAVHPTAIPTVRLLGFRLSLRVDLSDNRLKKTYLKYAREIQGTGGGLERTGGEHANLIGKFTVHFLMLILIEG